MKLHSYLVGFSLAGIVLGSPATIFGNDDIENRRVIEERMADFSRNEAGQSEDRTEPFELAEVDQCYLGSQIDPATGEILDMYGLCSEDVVAHNLDLA